MHAPITSLHAGRPAAAVFQRLFLTFSLVLGLLGVGTTGVAGPLPSDPKPIAFAFQGGGAGSGHRVSGWLTFDSGVRGTVDPVAGTAVYDITSGISSTVTRLAFVITDATTGAVVDTHMAEDFPIRIECINAADSLFRISAKGDLGFIFDVRGPLGSLFPGLELPTAAPIGTSGTWKITRLRAGSWSGDEFAYVTGEETAALLALLEEANAQIAALTTELGDARGELKKLQLDYKVSQVALAKATSQIEELTTELDAAKAQVVQLTTDLATANTQITTLTTQLEQTGAELKALLLDYKITSTELNKTRAQNELLTSELAAARAQATQLSTDLAAANALVAQLTEERNAALAELKMLRREYQMTQATLARATYQIEQLTAELETAHAQIATLTTSLGATQAELVRAQAEAQRLVNALSASQAENASLRAALAGLAGSFTRINAAIAEANKEPAFKVPGATTGDQLANLAAAIERLNPGQLKALRTELAGKK